VNRIKNESLLSLSRIARRELSIYCDNRELLLLHGADKRLLTTDTVAMCCPPLPFPKNGNVVARIENLKEGRVVGNCVCGDVGPNVTLFQVGLNISGIDIVDGGLVACAPPLCLKLGNR